MTRQGARPDPLVQGSRYTGWKGAMRTYHSRGHRVLSDGSVEIEGRWAAVQPMALGLLLLLPLLARSPLMLGGLLGVALALFVVPPRRLVTFDRRGRLLRIEHAGLFREPTRRTIPFAELRAVVFEDAGRRG